MKTDRDFSYSEVKKRIGLSSKNESWIVTDGQVSYFRDKLSNLSGFVREIKQRFARYYNKLHGRRGYFFWERFKSVIVEKVIP